MPDLIEDSMSIISRFIPIDKSELSKLVKSPEKRNFKDIQLLWQLMVLGEWFNSQYN